MIKGNILTKFFIYVIELAIIIALVFCIYQKQALVSILLIAGLLIYSKIFNKYSEIVVLPFISKETATKKDYVTRAFLHLLPYIIGIAIAIIWASVL